MGNCIKGLMFLLIVGFALIGAAAILPESAWEKMPAKLYPVRQRLAERGIISAKYSSAADHSEPTDQPAPTDALVDSGCSGGVCPVRWNEGEAPETLKTAEPIRTAPNELSFEPIQKSESVLDVPAPKEPPKSLFTLSADTLPELSFRDAPQAAASAPNRPEPAEPFPSAGEPFPLAEPIRPASGVLSGTPAVGDDQKIRLSESFPELTGAPAALPTGTEPSGSDNLKSALVESFQPELKKETFLKLNRILNFQSAGLTPNEQVELYHALDRLAFDVIYNPNEHLLNPPYVVGANQTLKTVAEIYRITPEFLAAINGLTIPTDAPLAAGTKLKVITGPVSAEVSFSRMELLLRFDGLYAGRFKMGCAERAKTVRGDFSVTRKIVDPVYSGPLADGQIGRIEGGRPENPLGSGWIELDGGPGLQGTNRPEAVGQTTAPIGGLIFSNQDISHLRILLTAGSNIRLAD